ncbi:MAG: PadR family transcriptional regulator [Anaerolineaceae bacterium]
MTRQRRGWAMGGGHGFRDRHSPLKVSMHEPTLLILLKERSRHGYTLLSDLAELGMGTIHPSVVYLTLRDLEELTWVQSIWEADQTQGPPRRTYSLTTQGEEALKFWLDELVLTRDLITNLVNRIPK